MARIAYNGRDAVAFAATRHLSDQDWSPARSGDPAPTPPARNPIADEEYAAGLARLHHAAHTESGPVVDALDLLVLRENGRS